MSEQNTQLANKPETGMTKVKNYLLSPEVKERFTEMMGANGIYYLNQVLIVVANSEDLQQCSPKSILISAMRAASLKLSVDPASGQAWIIPYKNEATFQIGYKGVYELALRTNLYRFINVIDLYEGETAEEDRMTGIHKIGGTRKGNKVWGRMLYFQLVTGYEKTFLMTVDEIDTHARHYSRAYNSSKSKWNDPIERPKMERKTVLTNGLRRWGRFNQGDTEMLDQIETEQGWTGGPADLPEEDKVTPPALPEQRPAADLVAELTGEKPPKKADPTTGEILPPALPLAEQRQAKWPADAKVSWELAATIINRDNVRYADLPADKLSNMIRAMDKRLAENHLEDDERTELQLKLDAAKIMASL